MFEKVKKEVKIKISSLKEKFIKFILTKKRYLRKEEKRINQEYDKAIKEEDNQEEKRALESEHFFELRIIQEEKEIIYTRKLLKKAKKLRVPIPKHYDKDSNETEFWDRGFEGETYLTEKGTDNIREAIRKEEKFER